MTKAEKTKQFIIETAAPLFNEKGIAGTSIDDVLRVTKVAKGCLYGHFESKEELAYAMVDHLMLKISANSINVMAKETSAKMKLFAFMDIYKEPLNTLIDGGCPILNFGVESDDTNQVIRKKIKTVVEKSIKAFAGIIQQGIANKEFSKDFNADEFALKMFTLIEGGIMVCRVMNSNKPMQTIIHILKQEIISYELK